MAAAPGWWPRDGSGRGLRPVSASAAVVHCGHRYPEHLVGPDGPAKGGHMGRVAIVTGASAGIGAANSRVLHERGFQVYAVARRLDRMAPLAALGVRTVRVDVTDEA